MIAEKAVESIDKAVVYELQNIIKNHGAFYASEHEGYAVLLEELQEAGEAYNFCSTFLGYVWDRIRQNNPMSDVIKEVKKYAFEMAAEAVQVVAVCERFEDTIEHK